MQAIYYLQTSNGGKIVRLERDYAEIVDEEKGPRDFNLANTLNNIAMNDARAAAKAAGLRLRHTKVMGVTFIPGGE
jgi:hypothetical protein